MNEKLGWTAQLATSKWTIILQERAAHDEDDIKNRSWEIVKF